MYQALLKNKWLLIAFVVLVLAGVQYFFGRAIENGPPPRPPEVRPEAAASPEGGSDPVSDPSLAAQSPSLEGFYAGSDTEYVSDEELIDTTEGFDPTPVDDQSLFDGGNNPADKGDLPPDGAEFVGNTDFDTDFPPFE